MKEKLTLSIDKEVKKRAKRHAKATGHSISEMVEEFLKTITADDNWEPAEIIKDYSISLNPSPQGRFS